MTKYYAKVGGYYLELSTAQGKHLEEWKKEYGKRDSETGRLLHDYELEDKHSRYERFESGFNGRSVYFDNLEEEFTNEQ